MSFFYSRVNAFIHSLFLSLFLALAFLSFDFDCYYAIIEMKIEAFGYHFEG